MMESLMNAIENEILQKLTELAEAVRQMPTANPKPNLLPLFERLDELTEKLPPATDPELVHFLKRKSYEKARAKLEGQSAARGSCGQ